MQQVILIAGASSGFGAEICLRLSQSQRHSLFPPSL
jgi:NADP-dependent 3-hydroxy acid dehydrogenase YdfG